MPPKQEYKKKTKAPPQGGAKPKLKGKSKQAAKQPKKTQDDYFKQWMKLMQQKSKPQPSVQQAPAKKGKMMGVSNPKVGASKVSTTLQSRVGVSSKPMNMHAQSPISGRSYVHSGKIYIGALKGRVGLIPGALMFTRRNRASMPGTYLQALAGMYTRWEPLEQIIEIEPSVGSGFSGQVCSAVDPDPVSTYNDTTTCIQSLSALQGCSIRQAWQESRAYTPRTKDHDNLFTQDVDTTLDDYTERFSSAGNVFIACVAVGDMGADVTVGSIWLRYKYRFSEPRLQLNLASDPSIIIPAIDTTLLNKLTDVNEGVGIMTSVMDFVSGVTLAASSIQSLYDAVVTFFDYIAYFVSSNALKNDTGVGVSPLEAPGYGVGHYHTEYKLYMTDNMIYTIMHQVDAMLDNGDKRSVQCWNSTTALPGLNAVELWFDHFVNVTASITAPVVAYNNYSGRTITNDGTQPNIPLLGGHPVYNPINGITYGGCWTFGIKYSVTGERGYADMKIKLSNFAFSTVPISAAFRIAVADIITTATSTDIRIDVQFTNKDSNVFSQRVGDMIITKPIQSTINSIVVPNLPLYMKPQAIIMTPFVTGSRGDKAIKKVINDLAVERKSTSLSHNYIESNPRLNAEFKRRAIEALDNAYMVQRALCDTDEDEDEGGSDVTDTKQEYKSQTQPTHMKMGVGLDIVPGGKGIKLRTSPVDPFPNGREVLVGDPTSVITPKLRSQSNK